MPPPCPGLLLPLPATSYGPRCLQAPGLSPRVPPPHLRGPAPPFPVSLRCPGPALLPRYQERSRRGPASSSAAPRDAAGCHGATTPPLGAGLRRPLAAGRSLPFPPPSRHAPGRGSVGTPLLPPPAPPLPRRARARPGRRTAAGEGRKRRGGGGGAFALPAPVRAPVRGRRCSAGGRRRGDGPPPRPRGSAEAAAGDDGSSSAAMGCLQSVACKARVRREQIVVSDVSATIEPAATAIEESSPVVLRYRTPYFRASARVLMPPIARRHTWVVGWIQACNHMEFYNTYSDLGV